MKTERPRMSLLGSVVKRSPMQ